MQNYSVLDEIIHVSSKPQNLKCISQHYQLTQQYNPFVSRGRRGRDCIVDGRQTTYAISVYHHRCEFESHSIQHYVI
jgi:hypothetical protein